MVKLTNDEKKELDYLLRQVRAMRKLRGLTLKEVADLIDTTQQTLSRLENGGVTMSTLWLVKLATAYNCTVNELVSGSDKPSPGMRTLLTGVLRSALDYLEGMATPDPLEGPD